MNNIENRIGCLIRNFESKDMDAQYAAREELIGMGTLALEPLIDFIGITSYADARGLAVSALTEISGLTLAETLHWNTEQWMQWWAKNRRS